MAFSLLAHPSQTKSIQGERKQVNSFQYGYRKCGPHARVLSRARGHGNSKIEIRRRNRKKASRKECKRKEVKWARKKGPALTVARAYRPLEVVATPRSSR